MSYWRSVKDLTLKFGKNAQKRIVISVVSINFHRKVLMLVLKRQKTNFLRKKGGKNESIIS